MLKIAPHIQKALAENKPVVALESTIISHGMPYPDNVKTALLVEAAVREMGAVPATIGIIDGDGIIGMSEQQIEAFGQRTDIKKASRRDLPLIYAHKLWGATTVATTMILAEQAGIEVFVTGGIGGVHRYVEETMDVSADLEELARTDVTVVCAGAKAILDLPKTLQYLETKGVPVYGFQTDKLPAFYVPDSGLSLDYALKDEVDAARIIHTKRAHQLKGAVLITVPIPRQYALDAAIMDKAIEQALEEAKQQHVAGYEVTPFLLRRVGELTKGASLESNIALILNNARVGARIAKALIKL
ncbi:MAG TPA: pseudouridine-5'-phosphate glycosidase [Bacilli bacterium]|nr:pseudouridine-5'-phosphate glycosidase [Bacilli bacterium]